MTLQGWEFVPSCRPEKSRPDSSVAAVSSIQSRQAAVKPADGTREADTPFESVLTSVDTVATPHPMNSDKLQGACNEDTSSVEMTLDVAPCTPLQSFTRQKLQVYETPECPYPLPSLSLGIGSSEKQTTRNTQVSSMTKLSYSQQFYLQQLPARPIQCPTTIASKSLNRIQLEVQRDGPEVHKENLLCLPPLKYEKWFKLPQNPEPGLVLRYCSGQPPPQMILGSLGVSPAEALKSEYAHSQQSTQLTSGFQNVSLLLPDSSSEQVLKMGKGRTNASSVLAFSGYSDCQSGVTVSKQFSESEKSLSLVSSAFGLPQESNLAIRSFSSSMDAYNLLKFHFDSPLPCTANGACTTSCLAGKNDSCQSYGMPVECVKYMQLLPASPCFVAQEQQTANGNVGHVHSHDRVDSGKCQKSLSLAPGNCNEQGDSKILVVEHPSYAMQARQPLKKKRQTTEQSKAFGCGVKSTNTNSQGFGQATQSVQKHGDHLPEHTRKHKLSTEDDYSNLVVSAWRENMGKHDEAITTLHESVASQRSQFHKQQPNSGLVSPYPAVKFNSSSSPDVVAYSVSGASDAVQLVNVQSGGLKHFTTLAHAQMPKALSTFSAGEPSLPLSLEFPQKVLDVEAGKAPLAVGSSTDADWGRFLALSATPVRDSTEICTDSMLPFQRRFMHLQAFLKQCDEPDQKDCLQALRSLSAAARSGHAVELETRAIRLSLEEGKEMKRMRMLNVLGRMHDSNLDDAGATPHGPRLPAPGAASSLKQSS